MTSSYVPPHKRRINNKLSSIPTEEVDIKYALEVNVNEKRCYSKLEVFPIETSSTEVVEPPTSERRVRTIYSAPNTIQGSYRRISSPDRKTPPLPELGPDVSTIETQRKTMSWSELCKSKGSAITKSPPTKTVEKSTTVSAEKLSKGNAFIFIPHSSSILDNRRRKASSIMNSDLEDKSDSSGSD